MCCPWRVAGVISVLGLVLQLIQPSGAQGNSDSFDGNVFLEKFGYLDDTPDHSHSPDTIIQAVTEFQRFNGLNVTGRLDRPTFQKMQEPRCGLPDVIKPGQRPSNLRARGRNVPLAYNAPGYKWNKNQLTYKINRYTGKLGGNSQIRALREAFNYWAEVTPLTFRTSSGTVDIDILFQRREHGDGAGNSFDGPGGTLAHAFFPGEQPIAGDSHFDDDETWTLGEDRGTNLKIVAAHEFGHALGLGHSSNPEALMAPFYAGYVPNFALHQDDIAGIQSLYGSGGRRPPTRRPRQTTPRPRRTTRRPTRTRRPRQTTRRPNRTRRPRQTTRRPTRRTTQRPTTGNTCRLRFDAIDQGHDRNIYAFRGTHIYTVTSRGPTNRRPIRRVYRGAPIRPGAVVYDRFSRKTYFFKGSRLWRYSGFNKDPGYPKTLTADFRGVRAAFQHANGGIYLFKRQNYTRWAERLTRHSAGYPRKANQFWRGLPYTLDSAFRSFDGYIYFFKNQRYWRYNSQGVKSPGYPNDMKPVWLNCRRSTRLSQAARRNRRQFTFLRANDILSASNLQSNQTAGAGESLREP